MFLAKGPPNFMQRLPRFPAIPDLTLLDRRKPKPFPWPHANTTFRKQIYISGVASTYRMHRVTQALAFGIVQRQADIRRQITFFSGSFLPGIRT
jgi:hypothetical protein